VTFAHPWMLLGALAALIPLLVHLFDRRRPRPHPFAAISFVLKSQRRTASRLKLKRLLLYVLRTLILLALPIALARPEWRREEVAASAKRGPAATAIVIDASLSMRYEDGKSLFEEGLEEARAALADLLPEEPASVLVCGANPSSPGAPMFDRPKLRSQVDEATATFAAADLTRCVDLAVKSLEDNPLGSKRVVIISDFTQNAFHLEAPPPTIAAPDGTRLRPDVVLRDVAGGAEALPNRAIVDLKIEPALQAGPRSYTFTFTVRNFSPQPVKNLEASLRVAGQIVTKGFLDLAPGGTGQKSLTHRFEGGGHIVGEVALTPDALTADDRRAFAISVPKELHALVVNGSPHAVRYRDEAFFVEAALTAPGSPVQPTIRDLDAAFKEDLAGYDLILLLNVPAPSEAQAAKLSAFVEKGGGLFLSMGDNVDPEAYNQRLRTLLPRPLRLVKTAAERDEAGSDTKAARFVRFEDDHPVFSPFTGKAREGLASSRFYRYMLLESERGTEGSSMVLASFEDGAPALAQAQVGKGRVLLLTSSVDRDWADFAIRTSFLPVMQRFSAYLCGALEERQDLKARVGTVLTLRPEAGLKPTTVTTPSGEELEAQAQPDGTYSVGPLEEPGVHTVADESGEPLSSLDFAATVDPAESDLSRLKMDALGAYYGEQSVKTASLVGGGPGRQSRTPFWTWLIVLAAVAFFFEGVLLRR
jgi:hypothetical protein